MIVGGILSPIENVLTEVLIWLHETGGLTWAWSIAALTVIVRMLLVPLAIKQLPKHGPYKSDKAYRRAVQAAAADDAKIEFAAQ